MVEFDDSANAGGEPKDSVSTSMKRQTFFGMYSGAKDQDKIKENLKSRVRRASGILEKKQSSNGAASAKRKPTQVKEDLHDALAEMRNKTGIKAIDYDDDLDDLFDDEEEEEGGERGDDEAPAPLPAAELQTEMQKTLAKEAARKRKEKHLKRKESIAGVNPKDFASVKKALHNAPTAQERARMRSVLLTEKFNAMGKGDTKTLGIRKTIKMTGKKQAKSRAFLCDNKDAAKAHEKNHEEIDKARRLQLKDQQHPAKTYAEFDKRKSKRASSRKKSAGEDEATKLPPIYANPRL